MVGGMSDLIVFLRERLADDEEGANARLLFVAEAKRIEARDRRRTRNPASRWTLEEEARAKRTLAEVAAKRALLEWLDRAERWLDQDDLAWHRLAGGLDVDWARQLLAQPYKDHPEWREEWAA